MILGRVDRDAGAGADSPFARRIYVAWRLLSFRDVMVLSHSDEGATWSPPALVRGTLGQATEGALPVVQPNGDLTIVYRGDFPTGPVDDRPGIDPLPVHWDDNLKRYSVGAHP